MPLINRIGGGGEDEVKLQTNKSSVTPTKSTQTVYPDSGYDGMTKVTVNSIPSSYVKPSAIQNAKTWTPTTSEQTILSAGVYCSGVQKISAIPVYTGRSLGGGAFKRTFDTGFPRIPSYIVGHFDGSFEETGDYAFYITEFMIVGSTMYYTAVHIEDGESYYGTLDSSGFSLSMNGNSLEVSITEDIMLSPTHVVNSIISNMQTIAFPIGYFRYIVL